MYLTLQFSFLYFKIKKLIARLFSAIITAGRSRHALCGYDFGAPRHYQRRLPTEYSPARFLSLPIGALCPKMSGAYTERFDIDAVSFLFCFAEVFSWASIIRGIYRRHT